MNKVELLAPAGNMECLETAFGFGADAVYIAGKSFGLRAFADNFSNEDIENALQYAHSIDKKIYITANAVVYNDEIDQLEKYICFLADVGVDGVIISDPSVVEIAKRNNLRVPLHLSTQVNTTNRLSAAFWYRSGVKRIVLSREVSLADIKEIGSTKPDGLELEAFVHGAMCIAHSGRCLMSSVLTGRSGNRGECAQPCRWEYHIHEKGYDGDFFPINEDERGTYLLNSKDLMMIEYIPELIGAGLRSLKIEGRMKSVYYVASVVNAYRKAIDAYCANPAGYGQDRALIEELEKSATRQFCTGFYLGRPGDETQDTDRITKMRKYTFAAKVLAEAEDGYVQVEQRNKFSIGDVLEVLSPSVSGVQFIINEIMGDDGPQQSAPHAQQHVTINCPVGLRKGDLLRRNDE